MEQNRTEQTCVQIGTMSSLVKLDLVAEGSDA